MLQCLKTSILHADFELLKMVCSTRSAAVDDASTCLENLGAADSEPYDTDNTGDSAEGIHRRSLG